ncbi:MAG: 7-cyano-7-deazaguanine synthase [Nitrososphaerales archaeon]|nr:7-cyano-7-deazaguanine synthase [Nitrososphaerales archaeon]
MAKEEGYSARALTFEFHGVASSELRAARAVARSAGVKQHRFVRLPDMKEAADIRGAKFEGLPPTYIPLRNSIFYSIAAGYAEEVGADYIIGGHNKDDVSVFRDAGREFFASLERALWAASSTLAERRTRLLRPLGSKTKPEVIRTAVALGVPLNLTWSCHGDGRTHCWRCAGCASRTDSFRLAEVPDPLRKASERGKLLK